MANATKHIPVAQAAQEKKVSKQCVHQAIDYGHINADFFGNVRSVAVDSQYKAWTPDRKRQKSARKRWGV